MMNRTLTAVSLLALGLPLACANGSNKPQTGQIELAIANAPDDVTCIQVQVAGTSTVERDIDVKPGQSTVLALSGLPTGAVVVSVNAFAAKCAALTTESIPTWIGDPVTTTILRDIIAKIAIDLHRNGRAVVTVDFQDAGSFFGPKCMECLKAKCGEDLKAGNCTAQLGTAEEGPAKGTSKAQLCNETIACVVATHCGKDDLSNCYCGAAPGAACTDDGQGTGPCKLAFERSFEAVQPLDVPVRFTDTSVAGGAAMSLLHCAADGCPGCL